MLSVAWGAGRHAWRSLPELDGVEQVAHAKKKGGKGGGGAKGGANNSAAGTRTSTKEVRDGSSYSQETRKIILSLEKIRKVAPNGKEVLNNVNLGMYLGAKIGVLGANGAGKSSLMRILAGEDTSFDGRLVRAPGIRIGYLEQEPKLDAGATVAENIAPAVQHIKDMVAEFEAVSVAMSSPDADLDALTNKMGRLQDALDACNGWEVDRQVEQAMDSLRCPPGDAAVDVLSGGERRRVALARLLLAAPDILLLDEPTNHLDAESVAWLERFLGEFKGTVVAVTHDRYFLDNVAGWILELDRGSGIPFEGNYSEWLSAKDKRLQSEAKSQAHLQKVIAHELEFISKQAKGQQAKGRARQRRYDELVAAANSYVRNTQVDSITIPVGPRLGDKVLAVEGVNKAFGERLLVDGMTFDVPAGAVVGIIGGNGAGKSTLFRMIMQQDAPDGGRLELGETSREALQADKTVGGRAAGVLRGVYEAISGGADEVDLNGRKVNARAYCSWYNFKSADQQKKVAVLSGGERNRLQLACVLKQSGNLLLLDEPTNDLDVDTLRCLEEAIVNFAGSVLAISHDRWFLDRVATHILAFEGESKVTWFEGGYSEYEEDRRSRMGGSALSPHRLKFRKLAMA
ncbi:P-loop containing nucleoside triphosphate hydrolase protein [Scenedesmus sp. NREL 46B-D3]|nr:P-loop containing nucleoside triphosphate hydrolase protein [Scenedesmus sp. NREL 46B-D3]